MIARRPRRCGALRLPFRQAQGPEVSKGGDSRKDFARKYLRPSSLRQALGLEHLGKLCALSLSKRLSKRRHLGFQRACSFALRNVWFVRFLGLSFQAHLAKCGGMTPAEPPPLPVEKSYNLLVVAGLIGGVLLVFAIFIAMLSQGIGKSAPPHRLPVERQLPANVPD